MSRSNLNEVPEQAGFTQKVDIKYLTMMMIQKVGTAGSIGDEGAYKNSIEALLNMLPKDNIKRIEEMKELYTETIEVPTYKYSCGYPMGSIEHPIYSNMKTDYNYSKDINNGEPVLVSPIVNEVEQTDYNKLNRLIMAELENINVTWQSEQKDRIDAKIKKPYTPLITLKDGKQVRIIVKQDLNLEEFQAEALLEPDEDSEDNSDYDDSEDDE